MFIVQIHSFLDSIFPIPTLFLYPQVYRANISLLQHYLKVQQDDLTTSSPLEMISSWQLILIYILISRKTVLFTEHESVAFSSEFIRRYFKKYNITMKCFAKYYFRDYIFCRS